MSKLEDLLSAAIEKLEAGDFEEAYMDAEEAEEISFEEDERLLWKVYWIKGRAATLEQEFDIAEEWFDMAIAAAFDKDDGGTELIQVYRGINFLLWGDEDRGECELQCAFLNGGETAFANVDPKYLEIGSRDD